MQKYYFAAESWSDCTASTLGTAASGFVAHSTHFDQLQLGLGFPHPLVRRALKIYYI